VVAALICYLVIMAMRSSSAAEGAPADPAPPAVRVATGQSL
jgi:hypothetical protein